MLWVVVGLLLGLLLCFGWGRGGFLGEGSSIDDLGGGLVLCSAYRLLTYLGSVAVIFLRVGGVADNLNDLGAWLSV